jgi:hypothetical protein
MPACHAGDDGFNSHTGRHNKNSNIDNARTGLGRIHKIYRALPVVYKVGSIPTVDVRCQLRV